MAEIDSIEKLIEEIGNTKELDDVAIKIKEVVAWKASATDPEEIRQADEALKILTVEIPLTIKARLDSQWGERLAEIVKFGLQLTKIVLDSGVIKL